MDIKLRAADLGSSEAEADQAGGDGRAGRGRRHHRDSEHLITPATSNIKLSRPSVILEKHYLTETLLVRTRQNYFFSGFKCDIYLLYNDKYNTL